LIATELQEKEKPQEQQQQPSDDASAHYASFSATTEQSGSVNIVDNSFF
jgi:hypothetical protein